ncbi:D-alanyl-D-alanine carboxypeptidase family protein [Haliovirga abyssi]|uniref:serine-type D-Ala-D-Ala carboxypeptidase n=1 Tax=Haliovirga abyssi TaxID=2996794 RepID=A0AAU9E092_9FUSO|nr:D-alanyl-D-alanine carboxypeptidase family protein [Haliovirga abyssi]BDU49725.1 D-alanyl-D-alanine carboxypeptidase [Haliovirga abyssi]
MKRISVILLLLLTIFSISYSNTNYVARILTDQNGNFIEGENITLKHPLASLTKMMTILVAIDEVEQGKIAYTDMVKVSRRADRTGGSSAYLKAGEKISLSDLMKAVIVRSGNDAAIAIAEYIAGSEDKFVKLMNEKAKELGMIDTNFYTATGLTKDMTGKNLDKSTVKDIAILSSVLLKKDVFMKDADKAKITISKRRKFANRNKLIGKVKGVDGLKTGHHSKAQYNVAITVKRDGLRFIVVSFGSPTEKIRDKEVTKYIDYAYKTYEKVKIASKGDFAIEIKVKDAVNRKIPLYLGRDIYGIIDKEKKWNFYKVAYIPKEVTAPVKANEKIGVISVKYRSRVIDEVPLVSKIDIKKISGFRNFLRIITFNLF